MSLLYHNRPTIQDRAEKYLEKLPPSIEGQSGDAALSRAIWAAVHGFGFDEAEALEVLTSYNQRAIPPWSERDLEAKIRSAVRKAEGSPDRGHLRTQDAAPKPFYNISSTETKRPAEAVTERPAKAPRSIVRFTYPDEPGTLLKQTTFSNGGTCEQLFHWDGFAYLPDRVPKGLEREIVYDWSDGAGWPRHLVDRLEYPTKPGETKRSKEIRPYHWSDHRQDYKVGEGGLPRVPFNAVELKECSHVFIVEGEKCAVALARRIKNRDIAVTTFGSCHGWRPELSVWFTRPGIEKVIILPDHDEAGRRNAEIICCDLIAAGVNCWIRDPWQGKDLPKSYDIADYLEEHKTLTKGSYNE